MQRPDYFIGFLIDGKAFLLADTAGGGGVVGPVHFRSLQDAEELLRPVLILVETGHEHDQASLKVVEWLNITRPVVLRCADPEGSKTLLTHSLLQEHPTIKMFLGRGILNVACSIQEYVMVNYFEVYQQMQQEWAGHHDEATPGHN